MKTADDADGSREHVPGEPAERHGAGKCQVGGGAWICRADRRACSRLRTGPCAPSCCRSCWKPTLKAVRERAGGAPILGRFTEIARLLTADPARPAEDGISWVRDLCGALGIPGLRHLRRARRRLPRNHLRPPVRSSSMKGNPIQLTDEECAGYWRSTVSLLLRRWGGLPFTNEPALELGSTQRRRRSLVSREPCFASPGLFAAVEFVKQLLNLGKVRAFARVPQ